jgi:hypothetical protein
MSLQDEGSIERWLRDEQFDWASNSLQYDFQPITRGGITISAVKHPDKTVEANIDGPFGRQFQFKHAIPECDSRGLFIAITWKANEMKFYLNAELIQTVKA